jgi:hypothetical protein
MAPAPVVPRPAQDPDTAAAALALLSLSQQPVGKKK